MMTQHQVKHALFPAGEMLKPEVREVARRFDLPTAEKKDSQGICFIGNIKMSDFLRHHVPDSPGEIVDLDGRVMGKHDGLHLYTLGQRKGHGVASPRAGMAYVVVGKDTEKNQLVVGWDDETSSGLYTGRATVGSLSWIGDAVTGGRAEVQPRYRAKSEGVDVKEIEEGKLEVVFARKQRALTPGQICAFYEGGKLLGGGVFERVGGEE